MQVDFNFDDMNWMALTPELILLATALALILLGLSKTFNTNEFLSRSSMIGVAVALGSSIYLWAIAPALGNPVNPEMFSKSLLNDRFAQSFNIIFLLMSTIAIFSAFRYPDAAHENKAEYFSLLLLAVVGMMFLAKAGNMITAFAALELFSISLYILCGFSAKHGTGAEGPGSVGSLPWACQASQESAIKYFLTGAFASAILLYGMALIYAGTGTTEIRTLGQIIAQNPHSRNVLVYIGIALLFSGLAFKVSLAPFHSWTPDVYQGAPTPITGFMSVATKAAAFAFTARVFHVALPELQGVWMPFLFVISILSVLTGNIAAVFQDDVKRMLAFSGVAHAGYLLIGIISNNQDGIAGILFYLAAYLFMNIGAFAVVYSLEGEGRDANSIHRFKGLAKRHPLVAAAMSLFMISLAGFPPTAGFFGKLFIFISAIKQGYILITVMAVAGSMVSVYFYLRVIVMMYFHDGGQQENAPIHCGLGALVAVSSAAVILFGIYPSLLMQWAVSSLPF